MPKRPTSSRPCPAPVGADYVGLEPRMTVEIGDRVRVGQPLFHHKRDPRIVFAAPGSGVVTAINRGARRVLKSVVIALEDETVEAQLDSPPDASATGFARRIAQDGPVDGISNSPIQPHSPFRERAPRHLRDCHGHATPCGRSPHRDRRARRGVQPGTSSSALGANSSWPAYRFLRARDWLTSKTRASVKLTAWQDRSMSCRHGFRI
jgi:hypothetical protein